MIASNKWNQVSNKWTYKYKETMCRQLRNSDGQQVVISILYNYF